MHQVFKPALKRAFTTIIEKHTEPDKPDKEYGMQLHYSRFLSGTLAASSFMDALIREPFCVHPAEFDKYLFTMEDYDAARNLSSRFKRSYARPNGTVDREDWEVFMGALHQVYLEFAMCKWVHENRYKWFERAVDFTLEWDHAKKDPHGTSLFLSFRNGVDHSPVNVRVTRTYDGKTHYWLNSSFNENVFDIGTYDRDTFVSCLSTLSFALSRAYNQATA